MHALYLYIHVGMAVARGEFICHVVVGAHAATDTMLKHAAAPILSATAMTCVLTPSYATPVALIKIAAQTHSAALISDKQSPLHSVGTRCACCAAHMTPPGGGGVHGGGRNCAVQGMLLLVCPMLHTRGGNHAWSVLFQAHNRAQYTAACNNVFLVALSISLYPFVASQQVKVDHGKHHLCCYL